MSAQYIIEILEKENITLHLEGDDLLVKFTNHLTESDKHFIKSHKPELVEFLQNQPPPRKDKFGRRQCLSCNLWGNGRCNHHHYIGRSDWGKPTYYTPDPALWVRCELHTER